MKNYIIIDQHIAMNQEKPIFLSNKPKGEDLFEGGSQKKIASNIVKLITQDYYTTRVIGIEGNWGSGKSNVVEIVKSQLGSDYYVFIFDAWGNQEDLTRKSFLEQLINGLLKDNWINPDNLPRLKVIKNELLAKTSVKHKEIFPSIKPFWLFITSAILLFAFLLNIYQNILDKIDFFSTIYFGLYKIIVSVYVIPFILFVVGLWLIYEEYKSQRSLPSHSINGINEGRWVTIGKILYWFQGKEIHSSEKETNLEDEPSVYNFREYFKVIENEITDNKRLLIVFDNLDRLEKEKIKSLWSSIHTFFSDSRENLKSWVIIPYNREELLRHLSIDNDEELSGIGFIEKSIPINFRVTPPVTVEWEKFFEIKLEESFGVNIIDVVEKTMLIKIFDNLNDSKIITPRQIVIFINNLVSLFIEWREEINNGSIKFRYLGIFILTKDQILKNPAPQILSREYLKNTKKIFEFDEDLDQVITAITFGVPISMADEILINRGIRNSLQGKDDLDIYKNHKAFKIFFDKTFFNLEIEEKINKLSENLKKLKNVFSEDELKIYWKNFLSEILNIDGEFNNFNDNHIAILENVSDDSLQKQLITRLISELKKASDIDSELKYFENLKKIESTLKEINVQFVLEDLLSELEFEPVSFIECINASGEEFKRLKIFCSEANLQNHYISSDKILFIDLLKTDSSVLSIVKKVENFKFKEIQKMITSDIETFSFSEKEKFETYIGISKKLFDKPIKLKVSSATYTSLNVASLDDDIYIDCLAIAISDPDALSDYNFQNYINSLTDEHITNISERIEWYITYGDFLKIILEGGDVPKLKNLKKIAQVLTKNQYGKSIIDLGWILKNYSKISLKIFENKTEYVESFIEKINEWEFNFNSAIENIDLGIFNFLHRQDLILIKKITDKALEYFSKLEKEQYLAAFRDEKSFNFIICKLLVYNELIKGFNNEFYSAYLDHIKEVARGNEKASHDSLWSDLIKILNGRKLNTSFTSVRDILIERSEITEFEIMFFSQGLVKYGNLSTKVDAVALKLILPMVKSNNNLFDVFVNNFTNFNDIIKLSQHKDTIVGELSVKLNDKNNTHHDELKNILKELEK